MTEYLSPAAVGELLDMDVEGILAHIRAGRLRAIDVRRPGSLRPRYRITREDFDAWLASLRTTTPAPPRARRKKQSGVTEYF